MAPSFFKKLRDETKSLSQRFDSFSPSSEPSTGTATSTDVPPVSHLDVLRYRYQHGTNLGSIFVLEKWMFGSMYSGSAGYSELDAVSASLEAVGLEDTREKWEHHWAQALTDADLDWLKNTAHCNCIRLPVGYFTLGPQFCNNTPFAGQQAQVYVNAWTAVKDMIFRCFAHGIGVLIDFHAVPGGANNEGHSGTDSHSADLWKHSANLELAKHCLCFIAQEVTHARLEGVIGIQLCNEACWDAPGMYKWYESVIAAIGGINTSIPIYISDAWDLPKALKWCISKNGFNNTNPIFVDNHKYYTFSESDRSCSPQQIIDRIPHELGELDGIMGRVADQKGAATVFIGEYSDVLDTRTWERVDAGSRPALTSQFGQIQSKRWQDRTGGCTYWSFKFDWMDGGDWGFKAQVSAGSIIPPTAFRFPQHEIKARISNADAQHANLRNAAMTQHQQYWDNQGSPWDHSSYAYGWDLGFYDARVFFGARESGLVPGGCGGGDKIGAIDLWIRKRMVESSQFRHKYAWEWEQGFRRAVQDFHAAVGI